MSLKYVLAYDHGTSGMKTAIISTRGELIGFDVEEYPLHHPEKGAAEQDPMDWWNALVNTTRNLLERNLVPVDDIIACTSSNQMCGTIPVDKDGSHMYNCLTWLDSRGSPMIKKLMGGLIEISGYGITNLMRWLPKTGAAPGLSGKDITAHILYIKERMPEIYERTWKFMDCKDFLNYKLTGVVATSYDCGIDTWLVNDKDPNRIYYDRGLVKRSGIDRNKLPDLYPSTHILGTLLPDVARDLGLNPATKVVIGSGDMPAAAIGSGAVIDQQAHICIGSSSWIAAHIAKRKVDITHMVGSIPSAIPGRYICLGEQESAGMNLTWLRDNLLYHKDELLAEEQLPDVYQIFDRIVAGVEPGADKVIATPWMFGERSPVEDHTLRSGIHNVSLRTDRRHLIRAIYEGVAFNSRWLLKYLEKLVGSRFDPITIVGGGARSDVWCQIYADILERKILQVQNPKECNSIGAACIASVALGFIGWDQVPDLITIKQEFTPRTEYRGIYTELFNEFIGIYKNNRKMYKRLNRY